MDFEKIKEEYNKKQFLTTLQNGKPFIRRGLLKRLLTLSGFVHDRYYSYTYKLKDSKFDYYKLKDCKFDYSIWLYKYSFVNTPNIKSFLSTILSGKVFKDVCNIFLGENEVQLDLHHNYYIINCNKDNISWGMLDEALEHAYPNLCTRKNGFVYLKPLNRKEINKIHETPHNFFNPYI